MSAELRILNEESLETLRNMSRNSAELVFQDLDHLVTNFDLVLIENPYWWTPDSDLVIPKSSSWEKNCDRENALIVFDALPGLTPVNASDERLWVTLAFGPGLEYSSVRWNAQDSSKEQLATILKNHWFCPTTRSRWRDQSISRLWWVGYLAHSCENLQASEVLDVLFLNSELINSFLGHPRSTSSKRTGGTLLEILHDEYIAKGKYEFRRASFRQLMHLVDLRGGKLQLDSLPQDSLRKILLNCFLEAHN